VHGSADDIVPAEHSRYIHAASGGRSELVVLEGVGHSFSGAGLDQLVLSVAPWLLGLLGLLGLRYVQG